jgi:hypothetical protein
VSVLGHLLEKLKKPDEEKELAQAASVAIDVDEDTELAAAMIEEVFEDDEAHRVQARMMGMEHEPVLEPEKQAAAPMFALGPKKPPT